MRFGQRKDGDNTYEDERVEEPDMELEEMGSLMLNVVVWERTLPEFPTPVARREYPGLHEMSAKS